MKKYASYADMYNERISSLVLSEFNFEDLTDEDKELLEIGDEEDIIDSIVPTFYYYACEIANAPTPFILVNGVDPEGEIWPAQVNNIYDTLDEAKEALKKDLGFDNIRRGIIKNII